jgi:hypothetical protein
MKYKVKTPSGVFACGEWRERVDIPEILMDRWEHRFFVEDGEIVEVSGEVSNPRESNGPTDTKDIYR